MGKKSKRLPKDFSRKVQGEWTLGHTIQELRENVCVGDTPLKDVSEEQLSLIWNEKIGTKHFREAVRREVVYRVQNYFKIGYEKLEKGFEPKKVANVVHQLKPKKTIDPEIAKAIEQAVGKSESI